MIAIQRRAVVDEYRQFSFQRGSVAFGSNGRLYYPHQARFESVNGRTGVLVEEGTTNLLGADTSSFEGGFGVWSPGGGTIRDNSRSWHGSYSAKLVRTASSGYQSLLSISASNSIAASPNTSYTISVWYLISPNRVAIRPVFRLWALDSARNPIARYTAAGTWGDDDISGRVRLPDGAYDGVWRRFVLTTAPTPEGTAYIRVDIFEGEGGPDEYGWLDGFQLEQKSYTTTWALGGTTRSPETLTVPTTVVDINQGTAEIWAYLQSFHNSRTFAFLDGRTSNNGIVLTLRATTSGLNFSVGTGGYARPWASVTVPGWAYMAVRWNNGTWAAFYNGSKVFEGTYTPNQPLAGLSIGKNGIFNYDFANTVIGPLRISRRARTDQEIAAAYAAGTLEADADTTLLLPFTGPDAQRGARTLYVPAVGF